jgi:hypothetical protein
MQANNDYFELIEKESIKILTRNPNKFLTYRNIHDEIMEDLNLKNPIDKENFKNRVELVLRYLPAKYNYINIKVIDGVLSACFSSNDENNESKNTPYSEDEKYIIRFIVDENLKKFYSKKDFRGNNILHYLILDNDYDRIKKIFNNIDDLFLEENNEGLTPIEIIKDHRISTLYINYLMNKNNDNEFEILSLNEKRKDDKYEIRLTQTVVGVIIGYLIFINFY